MKQQTIDKAVQSLNRSIRDYQRKLTYQLELKAEADLQNGNLKVVDESYMSNIMKYELILADLATIKRAIKNNKTEMEVYGVVGNRGRMYSEVEKALTIAGFFIDGTGYGTIWLMPREELHNDGKEMAAEVDRLVDLLLEQ